GVAALELGAHHARLLAQAQHARVLAVARLAERARDRLHVAGRVDDRVAGDEESLHVLAARRAEDRLDAVCPPALDVGLDAEVAPHAAFLAQAPLVVRLPGDQRPVLAPQLRIE